MLDKYFKKYYTENKMTKTKSVNMGSKSYRKGSCKRPQLAKFEHVDTVADENKDAFLGRSEGIKNAYRQKDLNNDVTDVLEARLQKKMVAPKVFGHGLHGTNVIN